MRTPLRVRERSHDRRKNVTEKSMIFISLSLSLSGCPSGSYTVTRRLSVVVHLSRITARSFVLHSV